MSKEDWAISSDDIFWDNVTRMTVSGCMMQLQGWVLVHEIRNKCNNHPTSGSALDPSFRWWCETPTECLTFRFHCSSCVGRCSLGDVQTLTEESGGGGPWQHVMSRGSKWFKVQEIPKSQRVGNKTKYLYAPTVPRWSECSLSALLMLSGCSDLKR